LLRRKVRHRMNPWSVFQRPETSGREAQNEGIKAEMKTVKKRSVVLVPVSFLLFVAAGAAAPPEFPDYGADDVVLFDSGRKVRGKIEKITKKIVYIKTGERVRRFRASAVWRISKGDPRARSEIKRLWGRTPDRPDAWYSLGVKCHRMKLKVEGVVCFEYVLKLDPDHEKAHIALGHALLDGKWLSRLEVKKKLAEGYVKRKGRLIKKGEEETTGRTGVKQEEKKKWPEHKRRILPEKKWSKTELARFEKERRERKNDAEKFRKQMEEEYRGVPWHKHYTVKTAHYIIECNSTRTVTQRYAKLMEKLYAMLARHFPPQRLGKKGKSVVRIYRNGDDFRGETGMFWGVGGFYSPITGNLCAYHGTFGMTATTFNVLAHEGTHQFQGKVLKDFRNVPMWLIEGLAVYFGDGARIDPSGKIVTEKIPRDRLLHIQDKIRSGTYTPLDKLVTLDRRHFTGSHYADSWALIHFLVNSGPKGQKLLSAYWNIAQRRAITGEDFEELAKVHSGSLQALEEKYLNHVMSLVPDPAGEIRGDYYYSREFSFELRRLGPKWRFYEEFRPGFLVGQLLPGTSAEVEVYFRNNDERAQSGEDYVKKYVLWYKNTFLPVRYSNIKAKRVYVHGRRAFQFVYEDGGTGATGGNTSGLMEELLRRRGGLAAARKDGKPRKYLEILLVDFDGSFSVRASTEKGEFAKFESTLKTLPECFEPIYQRRW